ncbi:hypothetical protein [Streptomyces sp. V4I8]|uniref:hypothetical protein n=1 Tax=Streptomyces sp. V4I8 TaxID=3156469 RepID=UPI003517A522
MRQRGTGFQSLHEALDTTTPGGRLVFHVFAALADNPSTCPEAVRYERARRAADASARGAGASNARAAERHDLTGGRRDTAGGSGYPGRTAAGRGATRRAAAVHG